ncbi:MULTISPECIES: DNRLRE domain-containing protein [unclassified Microbispora]|uniref:DNRLRE domain-containing protein n=1 Tax=unclassified Microbispora TaxID=2614687 RepID=UPI00143941FA|nr:MULTISPECIES: DNRLRE domain-containing protein [unclassified Microbispora]NJP26665.1 DNRLRE domain-containing protein [Microbispora sp. CL1-1]
MEAAQKQAAEIGRPVEVPALFTENAKVFAKSDGKTFQAEFHTTPIQLNSTDINGVTSWLPIDTTIVSNGGKLEARRVKTPLEFGTEGSTTLVSAKTAQGRAGFRWGKKLPAPQISGSRITYRDAVAKGADLVVTAKSDGFIQNIVLRERPKAPLSVRLPMGLPRGLTYRSIPNGGAQLQTTEGKPKAAPITVQATDAQAELSPDSGKIGKVETSIIEAADGPTLVLKPDSTFLADKAVTYPVTIAVASDYIGAGLANDAWVNKNNPDLNHLTDGWLRAGTTQTSADIARVYLRYNVTGTEALDGAKILNADLMLWNYRSGAPTGSSKNCGLQVGSGIVARKLTSGWDSTLSWRKQPSSTTSGQDANQAAYSDTAGCSGGGELIHSIEPIVQSWASGEPDYGLVLQAVNETAVINWRQYYSSESGSWDREPEHAPILFVQYEPATVEQVVSNYSEPPSRPISYEDAVAHQVGTPEEESQAPSITGEQSKEIGRNSSDWFEPSEELSKPMEDEDWSTVIPDCGEEAGDCFPEPTPDTVPPEIYRATPEPNTTDAPSDVHPSVQFDEPIFQAQLVLKNADGTIVAGVSSFPDEQTLVFVPRAPLAQGTYIAEVNGARDAAGNVMVPYTWQFSTTASAPPTPEPVNPNPYFEATLDPWYSYYNEDELTRSTDRAHQGIASAKFVPAEGEWGWAIEEFPVAGGANYQLAGWFFPATEDPFGGFEYGVEWYDTDWNYLSDSIFGSTSTVGRWQSVSETVAAPAGAANALILLGSGATIYLDEITLRPAAGMAAASDVARAQKSGKAGPEFLVVPNGYAHSRSRAVSKSGIRLKGKILGVDKEWSADASTSVEAGASSIDHSPSPATRPYPSPPGDTNSPAVSGETSADRAMAAGSQPVRKFYKHVTFSDCDANPNEAIAITGGWTKNSYSWCAKRWHSAIYYKNVFKVNLGKWQRVTIDDAVWETSSLIHTYTGGKVAEDSNGNPPAQSAPEARNIRVVMRIDKVWGFSKSMQDKNDVDTLRPAVSVSGCTNITGGGEFARTINQWSKATGSGKEVEFLFHSNESAANNEHKLATCTFRPYIALSDGFKPRNLRVVEAKDSPVVDCDTSPKILMYYGGCVLVEAVPRLVVSTSNYVNGSINKAKEFAQHLDDVFTKPNSTLPTNPAGKRFPGNGEPNNFSAPLTRAMDPQVESDNRHIAVEQFCYKHWSDAERTGKECDEYPFAKTYEGAANTAGWSYSVRPIPLTANKAGGARQNILWQRYRILDGDPFKVRVVHSNKVKNRYYSGIEEDD